jgi:hypothetical protein
VNELGKFQMPTWSRKETEGGKTVILRAKRPRNGGRARLLRFELSTMSVAASSVALCDSPHVIPLQARLDAPGVLHHVTARGIGSCALFHDDRDRAGMISRLAHLAEPGSWIVDA